MNAKSFARTAALVGLSLSALGAAGCSGGGGSHHHGPPVFFENEPNGTPDSADFIASVGDSAHFFVRGSVDAFGPDWIDGFAFVAAEPLTVEFELVGHDLFSDVDMRLYDPLFDETIAWFDSAGDEKGVFTILEPGKEFHLVIESFFEDTGYTLEIFTSPAYFAESSSDGPAATAGSAFSLDEARQAPRKERREATEYGGADEGDGSARMGAPVLLAVEVSLDAATDLVLELTEDGDPLRAIDR